jgi:hypothetical protein
VAAVNNTTKKRSIAITAAGMASAIAAIVAYVYVWRLQDINVNPPSILAISFTAFWLFGWQLDARLTAKNWRHVMKGGESNIFVNIIARHITRGRAWLTLVLHAAFTVAVACALAAMLSVAISPLVPLDDPAAGEEASQGPAPMLFFVLASAFLVFFGAGHLDAYLGNKEFVGCALPKQKEVEGRQEWGDR